MLLAFALSFFLFQLLIGVDSSVVDNTCYLGAYAVKDSPFNRCSGFRDCEKGYYCENGQRFLCPSGSFGAIARLSNSTCSGLCAAGYYCRDGSTIPTQNLCGNESVYCPIGSSLPLVSPPGYYTVDERELETLVSSKRRVAIQPCPFGHYCLNGIKTPCSGGSYGNSAQLSNIGCSGICPEGWFCPPGTVDPFSNPCSASAEFYCPKGTAVRQPTNTEYYAVLPHLDKGGGYGGQSICPRGSFCTKGIAYLCPGGRYGGKAGLTNANCTGPCEEGYYCPPGSVVSRPFACNAPNIYCPPESSHPLNVSTGYYTIGSNFANYSVIVDDGGNARLGITRVSQKPCDKGFYCLPDGIKRPCPAGRYGSSSALSSAQCDGFCLIGHYCPEGSTSERQFECGDSDKFCPPGSAFPQIVHPGYYTVLGEDKYTRGAERRCEPGFYCENGEKFSCAAGFYGDSFGLISSNCSGHCYGGFYCPLGSTSPNEIMCGDASRYCPVGSPVPLFVSTGYYSIGGNESTRVSQQIAPEGHYAHSGLLYVCPAGTYGSVPGLSSSSCSGPCRVPGYYCPVGSISPTMKYCGGDDVFCPSTTTAPIKVHSGFYTVDYDYDTCPQGRWRNLTIPITEFTQLKSSPIATLYPISDCQLCPDGTYKAVVGNSIDLCRPCNSNFSVSTDNRIECRCTAVLRSGLVSYFNISTGDCQTLSVIEFNRQDDDQWGRNNSLTRFREFPCEVGHYCINGLRYSCPAGYYGSLGQEIRPLCEGRCATGYFCLEASTSPFSYPCGSANFICPEGSPEPTIVPAGYYSNEDAPEQLRSYQLVCPVGYYCPGDGKRYPCAPGTYTDVEGTISEECLGPCKRGHYCKSGSPDRRQFRCGNSTVYCKRGSGEPTLVLEGFYGVFTGTDAGAQAIWYPDNSTFSAVLPCEPGYYCTGGIKYPCPPGYYGWRYGMFSSECEGKCAAGYYCPSYLTRPPDAPAYAVFSGEPHTQAAELECGDVRYFCPRGTFYPIKVGGGNFSIGGNTNNRTRSAQLICSPGSYCSGAISILCPPGRYGNATGLAARECTGFCPAGFYCPSGAVVPLRCPPNQYSTGSVASCSTCPGGRTTALPCQNEKACCFQGF